MKTARFRSKSRHRWGKLGKKSNSKTPSKPDAVAGVSIRNRKDTKIFPIYDASVFNAPLFKDVFGNCHPLFDHYSCVIPESFVAVIANGRCQVGQEEVFSSSNQCFVEITSQKSNPKIGFPVPKSTKKIKGCVANLSLSGLENNYYHFCVEWLARLHLLKKAMIDVDYYILPQKERFQSEYLDLLQIDRERVIDAENGQYIEADYLVVPSLINNWEPILYRGHKSYLKQWLPKWFGEIYKHFRPTCGNGAESEGRVYISRKMARYRQIVNEHEVIGIMAGLGFSINYLEQLSVEQQVSLFQKAKCIVSVHGAGLTNMCHCDSPAVIFEIYPEYYHDSSFRLQAIALGHRFEYVIGKTTVADNCHPQREDVYVDPVMLKRAMNLVIENHAL